MKIGIFGNCQHSSFCVVLSKMLPQAEVTSLLATESFERIQGCELILCQTNYHHIAIQNNFTGSILKIPNFYFSGFHPDLIMERLPNGEMLMGASGSIQSSLVLYGFLRNYPVETIVKWFEPEIFEVLGFHGYWYSSVKYMINELNHCGLDGSKIMRSWIKRGLFCYTANHPTVDAVADVCKEILQERGLKVASEGPFDDPLKWHGEWPIYPGIADARGLSPSFDFKFGDLKESGERSTIPLIEFIDTSLKMYESQIDRNFSPLRLRENEKYRELGEVSKRSNHVYSGLPDFAYWRKAISVQSIDSVDPVVKPRFGLTKSDKIVTAGSCFAQHIARKLTAEGFNYHVVELPPAGTPPSEALARGYGTFSARYGNIYTARQLRLLVERSLSMFEPSETAWLRYDGRWVDPYRPQIEPEGYESPEAVLEANKAHLERVASMFAEADVFVFTLGLTETWISKVDGSAFPVAPGVTAGEMDFERYCFVNFTVADVRDDLSTAIRLIRAINPSIRVIVTVSPVPLIATLSSQHVLTANTYSKSTLRAAVEEIKNMYNFVEYFPSYEIITGNYSLGKYFEADNREVNDLGISKVMGLFKKHYFSNEVQGTSELATGGGRSENLHGTCNMALMSEFVRSSSVICDEELLDQG